MRYSYYGWDPYVSVATRRAKAASKAASLAKSGHALSPITIEGRTIARTFWGKAWCQHLESFSDYENRLPRGRSYARNGSILDLQIAKGCISSIVSGSDLYNINVTIQPLSKTRWAAIKNLCVGQIDSLVEILQGRFSDAVMRVITDRENGLFPLPSEIKKSCSCPDSAGLCKHLAATFYGVGARLDTQPELLFLLRGVDHLELLEGAAASSTTSETPSGLDADDLGDVFGIEITASSKPTPAPKESPATKKSPATVRPPRRSMAKKSATKKRKLKSKSKSKKG